MAHQNNQGAQLRAACGQSYKSCICQTLDSVDVAAASILFDSWAAAAPSWDVGVCSSEVWQWRIPPSVYLGT